MEDEDSSQMAAGGASLGTLPGEVILHIFSFLPPEDLMFGVRPTCRHFYDLSRNPVLWKQVVVTRISPDSPVGLEPANSYSSERFYRKLLQQQCIGSGSNGSDSGAGAKGNQRRWKRTVRKLITSVQERGDIWPSCSVTGAMHYPNLERLTLVRENLLSVEVLVKHQRLTHLQLRTSHLLDHDNRQNVNEQLMIDLFENLKVLTDLQTLSLHFSCSECKNKISSISDIQASMKDYFLTGPKLIKIDLNCFVNDEIFKTILDKCLLLKDLAVICPEFTAEAFYAAVWGKCHLLSALTINNCETLNDTSLKALSAAFPELKSLQLSLTGKMTNGGLRRCLKACSKLTNLTLATSSGHQMLGGKTSENLHSLAFNSMTFPSSGAFQKLCQYGWNLREIFLFNISNIDLTTIANRCILLEKLVVYGCSGVHSIGAVFPMNNLPRLQVYSCVMFKQPVFKLEQLFRSRKRTRAGGLVLKNRPPTEGGLRSLGLVPCQLTAVGVSALAVQNPNLKELLIKTTGSVDDHIVRVILRNLPNLQSLRLIGSGKTDRQNQLTGACLRHVLRWGTRLQKLELVTHYRSFSIAALVRLLAHSSTLKVCVVPRNTVQNPDIPDSEIARMVTEQYDQLQRRGKTGIHRQFHEIFPDDVAVSVLRIRVFQG